tara:strand:- start:147 stop:368 length:222 start_codon:yes stop_codon:yes gene_type:complete
MKNALLFTGLLFIIGMTSCKKEYTCTCTSSGSETTETFAVMSKKDAKEACKEDEDAWKALGVSDATCEVSKAK